MNMRLSMRKSGAWQLTLSGSAIWVSSAPPKCNTLLCAIWNPQCNFFQSNVHYIKSTQNPSNLWEQGIPKQRTQQRKNAMPPTWMYGSAMQSRMRALWALRDMSCGIVALQVRLMTECGKCDKFEVKYFTSIITVTIIHHHFHLHRYLPLPSFSFRYISKYFKCSAYFSDSIAVSLSHNMIDAEKIDSMYK